jgi:hypothetical protein
LSNPVNKWFKRPDNTYVSYVIDGRNYFQVLNMPTTDPEPPISEIVEIPYKITLGDVEPITHEGMVKVRKGTA